MAERDLPELLSLGANQSQHGGGGRRRIRAEPKARKIFVLMDS